MRRVSDLLSSNGGLSSFVRLFVVLSPKDH